MTCGRRAGTVISVLFGFLVLFAPVAKAAYTPQAAPFVRGDANGDGIVSMADAAYLGYNLFKSRVFPNKCQAAADANVDGSLNIADLITILAYVCEDNQIPPADLVPPEGELTCLLSLVRSPELESTALAFLRETEAEGGKTAVQLCLSGVRGFVSAWRFVVKFPADKLSFKDCVFDSPDSDFRVAEVDRAGILEVAEYYGFMGNPGPEVSGEAVLATISFEPAEGLSDPVQLEFLDDYGNAEVVLDPLKPTVFPATAGCVLSFGTSLPKAPAGLQAESTGGEIRLSWTNPQAYDSIVIERDGVRLAELPGTAQSYSDMAPSGKHLYSVRGEKAGKASQPANAVGAVWTLPAPEDATLDTESGVVLSWRNPVAYSAVEIFRNGLLLARIAGTETTYTDPEPPGEPVVYYVRGISGVDKSKRTAVLFSEAGAGEFGEFGEDGVRNLTCAFREPGLFRLSWEPVAGVDGYRITRNGEILAALGPEADSYTDQPPSVKYNLWYAVSSVRGGNVVARRFCVLDYSSRKAPDKFTAFANSDGSEVLLSWINRGDYIGIFLFCGDEMLATLPGDTLSFVHDSPSWEKPYLEYRIHAVGVDFETPELTTYAENPTLRGTFLRGDANMDGRVSTADALFLRRYLFTGAPPPACGDAADANDDGVLNIADVIAILSGIYMDTIFPEPYPVPGLDMTADTLFCLDDSVTPGTFTDDVIRVGSVEGAPGDEVAVPVYLTNSVPVQAFQLVISYDPELFTVSSSREALDFTGTAYETLGRQAPFPDSTDLPPDFADLYAPEGERYFVAGAIWSFVDDIPIPPGEDQLLVRIRGRISEDAPVGATIALVPTNGPDNQGVGEGRLMNEITFYGESRFAALYPQVEKGFVAIKDNPLTMDFLRGDANDDGLINIADAVYILIYLFANGNEPSCPDSADVNDDGRLDLGDSIELLGYLFRSPQSAEALPPWYGRCTLDTTPDSLGGCRYRHCR